MPFALAALAGLILGAGLAAYTLSSRFKREVANAEQALNDVLEKHKQEQQLLSDAKQRVADLEYKLGEMQKDLNHLRNKPASSDDSNLH